MAAELDSGTGGRRECDDDSQPDWRPKVKPLSVVFAWCSWPFLLVVVVAVVVLVVLRLLGHAYQLPLLGEFDDLDRPRRHRIKRFSASLDQARCYARRSLVGPGPRNRVRPATGARSTLL